MRKPLAHWARVTVACTTLAVLCLGCSGARAQTYAIGADVSFLSSAEQHGTIFRDGGVTKPCLQILKDHGYNWVRLRIFVHPTDLPNNLPYTLALAKRAKQMGYKFLLDFHYSDTWADPGKQFIPVAWQSESHAELVLSVFAYTRDTMAAFRDAGVLPDMVQIGNEITNGMLWPDGKLPENWDHFADLVQAGINGVDAGRGNGRRPQIMIHIDRGGDPVRTKAFFDKLLSYGVTFDVIGQSYYPRWQGSLIDLHNNLVFMAGAYRKKIMIVETAYNWKPGNYTSRPAPFPESPAGQKQFLEELNRMVLAAPEGLGAGIFWWEPAVEGDLAIRGFFDDHGNALPVVDAFDPFTRH